MPAIHPLPFIPFVIAHGENDQDSFNSVYFEMCAPEDRNPEKRGSQKFSDTEMHAMTSKLLQNDMVPSSRGEEKLRYGRDIYTRLTSV